MLKNSLAVVAIIAMMVSIGLAAWPFPDSSQAYSGTPLPITIGEKTYETSALVYIAEDQGYFTKNGLDVTTRNYDSGPSSIGGLLNGEVDIGLSSEYIIVGKVLGKKKISVIGNIDKWENNYLICRKDRGIENISDVKGKRIGITRGASGEFYLGRFLDLHGMNIRDVALVDISPSQYTQAIANGSIDALLTGIYINQIQEQLGKNIVSWPVQSDQDSYWVVSCRSDWAAGHPEAINMFLEETGSGLDVGQPTEISLTASWPKKR